jgi:hypothetical protein
MTRSVRELFSREFRELPRHDGKIMMLSSDAPVSHAVHFNYDLLSKQCQEKVLKMRRKLCCVGRKVKCVLNVLEFFL